MLLGANAIALFGIGQTALLVSYASIMLNRIGRPTRLCNVGGIALADQILALQKGDAVLALAYGAAYPAIEAMFALSTELGLPVVPISDSLDGKLAGQAKVAVPGCRGRSGEIGLPATTLAALEAIVVGISASPPEQTIGSNLGVMCDRLRGGRSHR